MSDGAKKRVPKREEAKKIVPAEKCAPKEIAPYTAQYDKREFKVLSDFDECPLSILEIAPKGGFAHPERVRAIVQLSHGMQEHKERYEDFMVFLAKHGIASIINDHRGHGQSVRVKRDLGYFYDKTGRAIVEDTRQVQVIAVSNYPNKPLILFGHSMGSLVVRSFIKKYDRALSGLIVCGAPPSNPAAGLGYYLALALGKIKGEKRPSHLLQNVVFGKVNEGLPGEHPLRWLSANEKNVEAYDEDAYCGFAFSYNGYANLLALLKDAYNSENWEMGNEHLPILFIAGEEDPITGGHKKWEDAQNFLRARGYTNVSGKLFSGMRHEVLNEEKNEVAYEDALAFIEGVIKA